MAEFKIYGIGELLWDELPGGKRPGGAPANFAYVSTQLGDRGAILSRVGNDQEGDDLTANLAERGVDVSFVQRDERLPTGSVRVVVAEGEPEYEIKPEVAWDNLEFSKDWRDAALEADAVAFGTLGQRSRESARTIQEFLASVGSRAVRLVDLNFRQGFYSREILEKSLEIANAAKLNEAELDLVCDEFSVGGPYIAERLNRIRELFGLDVICLTRGALNSLILTGTEMSDHKIAPVEVADAVGAGDAFSAGLVHGLLRGWEIDRVNRFAGQVGSFVASRSGAMPDFSGFR